MAKRPGPNQRGGGVSRRARVPEGSKQAAPPVAAYRSSACAKNKDPSLRKGFYGTNVQIAHFPHVRCRVGARRQEEGGEGRRHVVVQLLLGGLADCLPRTKESQTENLEAQSKPRARTWLHTGNTDATQAVEQTSHECSRRNKHTAAFPRQQLLTATIALPLPLNVLVSRCSSCSARSLRRIARHGRLGTTIHPTTDDSKTFRFLF